MRPWVSSFLAALLAASLGCSTHKSAPTAAKAAAPGAVAPPGPAEPEPPPIPAPYDVAAPPADAVKTASGLAFKVLSPGTGDDHPTADDSVEVHYSGWQTDGTLFDSSELRHETAKFPLRNVIKGWTEGLQLMVEGEKRRFWIPADLAYGEHPRGARPGGMLVFDIELVAIKRPPPPPEAPADMARAPKSAKRTPSGLAYRVLQKGTGTKHPAPDSTVTVHYTSWRSDGAFADSTISRGEPVSLTLNPALPKGWTEGVQLMVEGEKTRFWLPADLATSPGNSSGSMVFDIELLAVK